MVNKKKILIISSANPVIGAGVGASDMYQLFIEKGYDVDLLTKYKINGYDSFLSVYDKNEKDAFFTSKMGLIFNALLHRLFFRQKKGYHFFYKKESCPPVPIKKVLKKINKSYDFVIVYFWQSMLSFATVQAIHEKLKTQFIFVSADYSIMSGGCHFTIDCDKFKTGCGACPAIFSNSKNDFTSYNVSFRNFFFKYVKPIIVANSYMINTFYKESYLLKNYDRLECVYPRIDHSKYYPMNKEFLMNELGISDSRKFIMFFGCQSLNDKRKGLSYLINALNIFYDKLEDDDKDKILILVAGRNYEGIKDLIPFKSINFGYVSNDFLPKLYSVSSVFLSPSVHDAGPMMLVQSIACGTPVVSFNVGYALDLVKNTGTGYCASNFDSIDFSNGISNIYNLSIDKYSELREKCRKVSIVLTSNASFIEAFEKIFEKYK